VSLLLFMRRIASSIGSVGPPGWEREIAATCREFSEMTGDAGGNEHREIGEFCWLICGESI